MKLTRANIVLLCAVLGLAPASGLFAAAAAGGPVDFGRDVRPILSDNCFQCHGPDEKARKAKLRLDTKDGAFAPRKNGQPVLLAGRSAESELILRVTSEGPEEQMPPPKSNHQLTPRQIDLLRRWVDEGAKWERHWAFVPPTRPVPPSVKNQRWPRNAIDRFVLARLEKEGLKPSPEATPERLIRRVTLDLTGLPPTPAEVDAFLGDPSPNAYEQVVDRLLASPRYGERMATDWLDLSRYADTHGYQMDRYRPVWPWRDWVIESFNRNLPFDQFVLWQLAGDLLPNATKEQRLATGFNRLHMQNEEGGIVEEEFRVAYVVDRVNTMGTAFLGLTFECCRCHDHKFDPLSQRDFYSLFAFFQNIDESGQTVYFGEVMPVPTLLLSTDAQDAKLAELNRQITEQEHQLAALSAAARPEFEAWLTKKPMAANLTGLVGAFAFDEVVSNHVTNAVDPGKPGKVADHFKLVPGRLGQAAELDGENGFTFPGLGHFTRSDPFTFGLWLRSPPPGPRFVVFHHSRAWMDAGSRGYELLLEEGKISVGLHHMWPGNSIKVRSETEIPANEWMHVAMAYDGSSRAAGVKVYVNGLPVALEVIRDGLWKDLSYGGGEPDLAIGHRFRDSGFKGGQVDEFRVFNRALSSLEVAYLAGRGDLSDALNAPPEKLTAAQREALFDYFVAGIHTPTKQWAEQLHALRTEQRKWVEPIPEAMVMQEMPQPKPAYVLKRGAYDARGDLVTANTPAALPPLPANAPHNRLGLARWLLAPDHPLTARVTVNRAWQQMFGKGIVETSDNFGSQGTPPTHPELLDWLAREFVDTGWDLKRLLKLVAMSATYRQASGRVSSNQYPVISDQYSVLSRSAKERAAGARAQSLNTEYWTLNTEKDPVNRFLWHAPARRLTAEMLRDQALLVSGLLAEKIGGPSVKPYQPPGLWEIAMGNPKYDQGKGNDLHRRSLYTYWKRTVPNPAMMTFDAADRSNCAVRRQSTSTPLQALALLNDVQIIEAARLIGQRMMQEGGPAPAGQVAWAFRAVTGRKPTPPETEVLLRLLTEQRELFTADADATQKLLASGETKQDASLNPADLAAGAVLAEALLNHDEAVMRR